MSTPSLELQRLTDHLQAYERAATRGTQPEAQSVYGALVLSVARLLVNTPPDQRRDLLNRAVSSFYDPSPYHNGQAVLLFDVALALAAEPSTTS